MIGADGVRLVTRTFPAAGSPAGPTLVLHHGLASSQHIWDLMLPSLVRRHRVVTFDARGHGRSAKPTTGYGFDHTVTDAIAVIRATGGRRSVLVGHSWGAMVAIELAARYPRAVAGVVLVDGGISRMRDGFPDWAAAKQALAPPHLAGIPVEEFRASIGPFLAGSLTVTPQVEDIVLSVMRVDAQGRIHPRLSRANHFRILRAIWEQDPPALHRLLRVPGLAVMAGGGDPDWDARRRAAANALRASGAPVRVSWIEGIHDLPLQHPKVLARRIGSFARSAVG